MRLLLLALIRFYKRFISPHKGFECPYRVYTGRASCSTLGYRAIRRHGVVPGLRLLQRRCQRCGVAQRRHAPVYRKPAAQRGDCDMDPGCDGDGCEIPGPDCDGRPRWSRCCGLTECCGDVGDCGGSERKKRHRREKDRRTHLPPRRPRADWPEDARR